MTEERHKKLLIDLAKRFPPSQFENASEFLSNLLQQMKALLKRYDNTLFSEDLGLGKNNTAWLMIKGKRAVSEKNINKILLALSLRGSEKLYLKALLENTQKSSRSIVTHTKKMLELSKISQKDENIRNIIELYSEWHNVVIFELMGLSAFRSDVDWIAKQLNFKISHVEIKKSLELLEDLGYIKKKNDKFVRLVEEIDTKDLHSLGIVRFHEVMMQLARDSIDSIAENDREISALTLAVSNKAARKIQEAVRQFQNYVLFLASEKEDTSELVQINLQFFPLSKKVKK